MIATFLSVPASEGETMRRPYRTRTRSILVAVAALLAAAPADASSRPTAAADRVDVYTGELTAEQLQTLNGAGVDHADVLVTHGSRPAGSPGSASELVRSQALIDSVASVVTRDRCCWASASSRSRVRRSATRRWAALEHVLR